MTLLLKLFQLWQRERRTYALHAWRVIFFYFKQTWVVILHPSIVSHQTKCKGVCQAGLVKRARFPVSKLGFKENQCSFKPVSSQRQFPLLCLTYWWHKTKSQFWGPASREKHFVLAVSIQSCSERQESLWGKYKGKLMQLRGMSQRGRGKRSR